MAIGADDAALLDERLLRWEECWERGQAATPEDLCRDRPDLVDELKRRIAVLHKFDPSAEWTNSRPCASLDNGVDGWHAKPIEPVACHSRFGDLELCGSGGLGIVYKAESEELKRNVALKFIRPDLARFAASRRRFLSEVRITGQLEHPGIVPVYALGVDGSGQPCYAMRLIHGKTLDEVIGEFHESGQPGGRLNVSDRRFRDLLNRFKSVCKTMAYAHSRGIIHRDVKPKNIMLGPYDETLVVDWGLAKTLDPAGGTPVDDRAAGISRSGDVVEEFRTDEVMGTVGYMSPEQTDGPGGALGPRSDIYSLGATLYKLLVGQAPFQGPLTELIERIRTGDFDAPTTAKKGIPRGLEAICLKAMAPRQEDRYESAEALADDVENWLADRSVLAWREPWWTRTTRWMARHRSLIAAATSILLFAMVSLATIILVQHQANRRSFALNRRLEAANRRADQARLHAEKRLELALRAVENFRQAVADNPEVRARSDLGPLRRALLEPPLEFYRQLREEIEADGDAQPGALLQLAKVIFALAGITAQIDSEPSAIRSYHEGIGILTAIVRSNPEIREARETLAGALGNVAMLERSTHRLADAEAGLIRARAIYSKLVHDHPESPAYPAGLAHVENNLAVLLRTTERPTAALAGLERACNLLESVLGEHPTAEVRAELALVSNSLGVLRISQGEITAALAEYERARELQESLVRDYPAIAKHQVSLANTYYNLGNLHLVANRPKTNPLESFERARALQETLVRDHPSVTEYQASLAKTHGNIGTIHRIGSRWTLARASLERTRDILQILARDHSAVTAYRNDLALTYYNLGILQVATGQAELATAGFQLARDLVEALVRDDPQRLDTRHLLAAIWHELGSRHVDAGRRLDALDAFQRAIAQERLPYAKALPRTPFRLDVDQAFLDHLVNLGRVQADLGKTADALGTFEHARKILNGRSALTQKDLYDLACIDSRCSLLVATSGASPATAAQAQSRALADRAMDELRQAVSAGYLDRTHLNEDRDIERLRGRADFQLLMMDLALPADPFAR